jgi:cytochrome c-type biogenesis protein CcmF
MWSTFPIFGSTLLLCVMVVASYTFAVAVAAGTNGKPRTLQAARFGAYGTVALVAVTVLCLAYAFVSHDFRIRYVTHYSDRSMPIGYLFTALWGGQDGSLLWWLFLLSIYIGVCVKWLGKRYLELQPWVIATLMGVVLFFCILMAFAANPFSTNVGGAKPDGEGLNPLLQNFYMIIHPPSLYTGFVGCTIPFAFAVAALITGRLDHEWIVASRKWTLFAWLFLAIGNTLGMLWAYEELGWGGYWAWDPVENAAFMPFLSATAYVHSVMIQERRGMLKVWNVLLICLTFFMTIFGTFLTRSGAIASVHSFAQSSIGTYFVWFLVVAAIFGLTLIFYRWPELRDLPPSFALRKAAIVSGWLMIIACGPGLFAIWRLDLAPVVRVVIMGVVAALAIFTGIEVVFRRMTLSVDTTSKRPHFESVLSREFTFLLNNWGLLALMTFILVATTFPMLSEALSGEKVSVGPPYYNAWVQPLGLIVFLLMGIGTLFGWKKTSPGSLRRAFIAPAVTFCAAGALHLAFGKSLGFPAIAWSDAIYEGSLGNALRVFNAVTPVLGVSACAFNAAVIIQEFTLLFLSRRRSGAGESTPWLLWVVGGLPGFLFTLVTLPAPARRRYGGYVVHFGIVLMFFGFTGHSWNVDKETSLQQGDSYEVVQDIPDGKGTLEKGLYRIQYVGFRREVDNTKMMLFADVDVFVNGKLAGRMSPARYVYKKMSDSPTTEVAQMHRVRDDLYLVVGNIDPDTKTASFQIHVNPLVSWIWFGCIVLILGSIICMWPQLEPAESRVWAYARSGAAVVASICVGILIASTPTMAYAQQGPVPHSGTVHLENDFERSVFSSLRCMCGCAHDVLSTCPCSIAEDARNEIREKLARGVTKEQIMEDWVAEHGPDALSVPPNTGALRAIWAVPLAAILAGGAGLAIAVRRWRAKDDTATRRKEPAVTARDEYDARLDAELKDLDG